MSQTIDAIEDEVVLLDESGTPIGRAPKSAAHGPDTALHLAFSCHVLNALGEVLVTRRALTQAGLARRLVELVLRASEARRVARRRPCAGVPSSSSASS